jgi:hypothetical protein
MVNPTLLKTPIASGGDKNTIPETTGSTTGLLSQEKGWQQINSLPINAGGIAPSRLDFNGVFNLLSNILFYTQKGWVWEFDETQNYFAGCTVKDTADGKTYVCIADVNASTTHPSSDTTHWKLSDLATKDDLANYLPLSGGAMTGDNIKRNVDNSSLELCGASQLQKGAYLSLNGQNANAKFDLVSQYDANTYAVLEGTPTGDNAGTLTWCGHNVLTDANGGYLPLSGGAMTGTTIRRNVDDAYINLVGGNDSGAQILMFGKDLDGGSLHLYAGDGSAQSHLYQTASGSLMLVPDNINNPSVQHDLGGSAIVAKALGTTGYIKYANGLIIQWGESTNVATVQFPITFPTACSQVMVTIDHGSSDYSYANVIAKTTASFTLYNYSSIITQSYIAVGY